MVVLVILPTVAVMVSVPRLKPVAIPVPEVILAIAPPAVQARSLVIAAVLPSEYVPVAVNCWVEPSAMVEFAGVTAKLTKLAVGVVLVLGVDSLPPQALKNNKVAREKSLNFMASFC